MKKRFRLALVITIIVSLFAFAGCGSKTPAPADNGGDQPKVLKVGSEIAYAPFESYDEKNNPVGFDIELLTAIAEDMGYKAEFQNASFDGLIPSLQAGKYDCVISAMTITEERAKSVLFSDPYFKAVQFIAFKKGGTAYQKLADLKNVKVGVQLNTTGQFAVEDIGIKPKKFETAPEAMNDLLIGGVDAAVIDNQVVLLFIQQNPNANIECVTADTPDEFYGIAFNLNNKELADKVNASLKKLKDNGKYAEIYSKYFEGEVPKF
jgi:polar amino acid transport system substrate-binding protein